MFSFLAKSIRRISKFPKTVIITILIISGICPYFISNLRWELQLQDVLRSDDEINQSYKAIESSFGGIGSLTVIFESEDSLKNHELAKEVSDKLMGNENVHFVEFETDLSFFDKYKFFYINNEDLDTIVNRVDSLRKFYTLKNNPLFVDIAENDSGTVKPKPKESLTNFHLDDLEKKYYDKLKHSHTSRDGKIRILDIYPTHSISDLYASRELYALVRDIIKENPKSKNVKVYYTGKLYDVIQTGRAILPEAKNAGKIMALLILVLLIFHFRKHPQLILISAIPIGIPVLMTLAIAYILYGRINLFSLILILLMPGLACQIITHILTRYFRERAHKLSPALCIESAILSVGPSTAATALIMSFLFLGFVFIPIAGLRELGILGAIGCLLNWIICTLLIISFLRFAQSKHPFKVPKLKFKHEYKFTQISYKTNYIVLGTVVALSIVALLYGGINFNVFYDFKQTEIQRNNAVVDSLIAETEFPQYDPIIVKLPDAESGDSLVNNFQKLRKKGLISTVDKVITLSQISPSLQPAKIEKLKKLSSIITPSFTDKLSSNEEKVIRKIEESLDIQSFEETEFTKTILQKFSNKDGELGVFAFIFPNINPNNGLECRHLDQDLKKLDGVIDGSFKLYGTPLLRAAILDRIYPNLHKATIFGSIMLCFLLLLFYNNLSRAVFTLLPSLFATSWILIILAVFNLGMSIYTGLALTILIGASIDGSLQLWAAFYEKQGGTALIVLQRKFSPIVISQMASLVGTYGLLISSHPGLKSTGIVSLIGLLCIFVAQLTIFPLIAGALDNYRLRKRMKNK